MFGPHRAPSRQQSARNVLDREREAGVVPPRSVDMEVTRPQPLGAEAELLGDPQARDVLRTDVDLDPVQADGGEAVVDGERQRSGDDAAAGHPAVDPVPGAGRTPRTP